MGHLLLSYVEVQPSFFWSEAKSVGVARMEEFLSEIGRTEIRSQVVVALASLVTEKLVKVTGFWMPSGETSRIP